MKYTIKVILKYRIECSQGFVDFELKLKLINFFFYGLAEGYISHIWY